ncbi:MAG: hypothetical protein WBE26_17845 [Phycisphaerae bacterium]
MPIKSGGRHNLRGDALTPEAARHFRRTAFCDVLRELDMDKSIAQSAQLPDPGLQLQNVMRSWVARRAARLNRLQPLLNALHQAIGAANHAVDSVPCPPYLTTRRFPSLLPP